MTSVQKQNRKLWIIFFIALIIALLPWVLLAQGTEIKKEKFNLYKDVEDTIGYVQAIKVGNTLYISGAVSGGPMHQAVKNVYTELTKTLAAYNATFKNVVKENAFTTDIEALKSQQELRKKYYNGDFPTATWIQVQRLYSADLVLEVELIAELPPKKITCLN